MGQKEAKEFLKEVWNWLWNSDSWQSYLVFLALVFVTIKFIFFPLLGLAFSSSLPLAIVESSSMDHSYLKYCESFDTASDRCLVWSSRYEICGDKRDEAESLGFSSYWQICGGWYERNTDIAREQFESFKFKNGFSKGDILVLIGWRKPKIGDVILFTPNQGSAAPRPIIHRVVGANPIQTKGDHNENQLRPGNNAHNTDETEISDEQIIGIAVSRIPKLGWAKLIFVEAWKKFI